MKTVKYFLFFVGMFVFSISFSQSNVALNKSASITQGYPTQTTTSISKLIDGNTSVLNQIAGYMNSPSIAIDLSGFFDLSSIKFYWGAVNPAKGYTIATSTDNTTWTNQLVVANNTVITDQRSFSSSVVNVRFIRIFGFETNSNKVFDLSEIEVNGTANTSIDGSFKKLTVGDDAVFNKGITANTVTATTLKGYNIKADQNVESNQCITNYLQVKGPAYFSTAANVSVMDISGDVAIKTNLAVAKSIKTDILTVKTKILTGELEVNDVVASNLKVKMDNLADYVFAPNYKLRSLAEVENYVTKNNHLPDMPSAATVKENGMNVAEMNNLLLQKVEELTLYMIEQNKKIASLEAEIEKLKKE